MVEKKISLIIKKAIQDSQKQGFFSDFKILPLKLEHPQNFFHGDYSTNVALEIGKTLKKNPMEVAEIIASRINNYKSTIFEKIEVAKPGFINFFLSQSVLIQELKVVFKEKEKYGSKKTREKKTVVIDYSSPNIAKPFGIGHLRSTIIGQALYNIYQFLGWKCIGDNHLGDWGTQFGKIIVAIKKWSKTKNLNNLSIGDLEKLYVKFHREAEKNPDLEEEAREWFKKLEDDNPEAKKIWQSCIDISLKEFEKIYRLLNIDIDYALGESFYQKKMKPIIKEAVKKRVAKKSQGTLVIKYPQEEFPPVIILKSDGATTYFTRDLATIKYRLGHWDPDLIIYEVGADQTLHFKQLFRSVELLGWAKKEKFFHVAHGLIRFKEGKFSTRKGLTIHLEEVLEEAVERAEKIIKKSKTGENLSEKERKEIARMVGIGGVKYNDLSQHYSKDIIFDWDKILNLKGNSAPYLQYTYARCQSILRKVKFKNSFKEIKTIDFKPEERNILRTIYKFPETVRVAAQRLSPNLIASFAFDLAQKYNLFYGLCPIIRAETQETKEFRLFLTAAVAQLLKNSLSLLGIFTPQKM